MSERVLARQMSCGVSLVFGCIIEILHIRWRRPFFACGNTSALSLPALPHFRWESIKLGLFFHHGNILRHHRSRRFLIGSPTLLRNVLRYGFLVVLRLPCILWVGIISEICCGWGQGRWIVKVNRSHYPSWVRDHSRLPNIFRFIPATSYGLGVLRP